MKKAFDQTVREIKREVNKKVLKVPGVEQKVLDATSNEPWGPHGSLLAEISQATRNYHDYQLIMTVIWKRLNDTGKNWRHVYKALIVLEYLVAHGSERVIDEIREHAYQISTLSNFQYIDSNGRDRGSNVRKKSQCLVVLVNDKERIQEVRQKAAANRDKFRSASLGGMYRPSSYYSTGGYGDRYDDDRYGGRHGYRDDDWNGYGRERERGYRDDEHYGRYGESYGHDGDRYGRDSGERYSRDGYREDDYWGRSQSSDNYRHGSIRSSDKERDRAYEDDGKNSLRGNGTRADDHSQDGSSSGRRHERKLSEQNLDAPPSYEEAVGEAQYPVHGERNGETSAASPPKMSPPTSTSPSHASFAPSTSAAPASAAAFASPKKEADGFNDFDPQSRFSAPAATSNGAEVDLLGSLSEPFSSDRLAVVPVASGPTASDVNSSAADISNGSTFAATAIGSPVTNQPFEDPFGDGPFRALSAIDGDPAQSPSNASFHPSTNQRSELPQPIAQTLSSQNTDILADILPPSGSSPLVASETGFPTQDGQPTSFSGFPAQAPQPAPMTVFAAQASQPAPRMNFPSLTGQPTTHSDFPAQIGDQSQTDFLAQAGHPATSQTGYLGQANQPAPLTAFSAQTSQPGSLTGFPGQSSPHFYGNFLQQQGSTASHFAYQNNGGSTTQYHTANFLPLTSPAAPIASQMAPQTPVGPPTQNNAISYQPPLPPSIGSLVTLPQPAKEKFEPKSAVWADTLNRGIVNLNISGPKTNPLADIGVDFEAMNRKEKRMEKPTTATVTSTVTMGKAMGSGSGIGRAGAGALRPPPNPMMGPGIGMGGYGGVNQPMGMGMGMGMGLGLGMGMGMGMGMNMGIEQGSQMPPYGFPPGSAMPGGYNPTMGSSSFASQQPFGGGYR